MGNAPSAAAPWVMQKYLNPLGSRDGVFLDMMDNVCKLGRGKLFLWLFSLSGCFTGSVGDEHRTDDNKSTRENSLAC